MVLVSTRRVNHSLAPVILAEAPVGGEILQHRRFFGLKLNSRIGCISLPAAVFLVGAHKGCISPSVSASFCALDNIPVFW